MVVQSNIPALTAQRNLRFNHGKLSKHMEKLSSGFQINRASDDASGLAISEKMSAQITGLTAAKENVYNGTTLIQVGEV